MPCSRRACCCPGTWDVPAPAAGAPFVNKLPPQGLMDTDMTLHSQLRCEILPCSLSPPSLSLPCIVSTPALPMLSLSARTGHSPAAAEPSFAQVPVPKCDGNEEHGAEPGKSLSQGRGIHWGHQQDTGTLAPPRHAQAG